MAPGIYVPLFNVTNIQILLTQMTLHPSVPFVVTINPSSGAIDRREDRFTFAITEIKTRGGTAIGYIYTNYAARPLSEVYAQIDLYLKHYPNIDGIMLDEVEVTRWSYYQQIVAYARNRGMSFVRGNPGGPAPASFFTIFDMVAIEEDNDYQQSYPIPAIKDKAAITIHSTAYNETEIRKIYQYANYAYVTDDIGPPFNPYDRMPSYFSTFCTLVDGLESTPPPPPPPDPDPDPDPGPGPGPGPGPIELPPITPGFLTGALFFLGAIAAVLPGERPGRRRR